MFSATFLPMSTSPAVQPLLHRPLPASSLRRCASKHAATRVRAAPAAPRAFAPAHPTTAGGAVLTDELAALRPPALPMNETILLEGFGWQSWEGDRWWRTLRSQVPELQRLGFTHVWLPPPSASVSTQGYLPGQLYQLNSRYGKGEELRALCADLLKAGIRPVADVVINHRCADAQDHDGTWNIYWDSVPHPGKSIAWGKWAIAGTDLQFKGQGSPDSGEDYGPAPDLDHTNPEVRDSLVDWLNWLHLSVGFEGWRFDFVKGYAARFTSEYVERSVGPDTFCVGELFPDLKWNAQCLDYCQDAVRSQFQEWLRQARHCCLFDFPIKGQLQEAAKHHEYDRLRDGRGRANGLLGVRPERAVTFVDNHDTGSTQQHWPFPRGFLALGYAYILTHPGMPCVLHEHLDDPQLRQRVGELVALRKRAGIRADSQLEILAAEKDMYVARINGNVTLKLGPRFDMGGLLPKESEGWKLALSGNDYAIWEKRAG